jgi:hypothetical protein
MRMWISHAAVLARACVQCCHFFRNISRRCGGHCVFFQTENIAICICAWHLREARETIFPMQGRCRQHRYEAGDITGDPDTSQCGYRPPTVAGHPQMSDNRYCIGLAVASVMQVFFSGQPQPGKHLQVSKMHISARNGFAGVAGGHD